ncbi:Hypothetical protein PAS_chr2-1_0312 [Komagataella phaffii GS115]|uniref:Uncharacterized protein n=1 Tax=Komagataella phaffii (strain GS115 / ATCC 20864) TaxID=644223 RepID=C4R0A3_KOMPG|nr:Hypothetical protein PAS_chr2-1_0312 [Komagataella phaffii GS115]CAY68927.1 Hypothetical protein PAS_chr2-1_0312 [Komagataella phaffii GS115]
MTHRLDSTMAIWGIRTLARALIFQDKRKCHGSRERHSYCKPRPSNLSYRLPVTQLSLGNSSPSSGLQPAKPN